MPIGVNLRNLGSDQSREQFCGDRERDVKLTSWEFSGLKSEKLSESVASALNLMSRKQKARSGNPDLRRVELKPGLIQ